MSKFDFMNFTDGLNFEFVAHAKKYTKEETISLCLAENGLDFQERKLREPVVSDIRERTVKYFVKVPEYCDVDTDGGCYTYCNKGVRGNFPVWVIELNDLKVS